MGDEHRRVQLRDLCDSIDYGLTASATDVPLGPRFLRITDIVQGALNWSTVPYVAASESDSAKYRLRPGDVVVARTGATTGYSACVLHPPESLFASYLVRFSVSKQHDPRFVGYLLKGPQWWEYIHGVLGDKSAQPNASASTLADAWLDVPPLSEQRAIAEVLGALDDKIEANRRIREIATRLAASALDDVLQQAENSGSLTFERLGDIAGVNLRSAKPSGGQLTYLDIASVGNGDPGRPTTLLWVDAPSRARRRVTDGDTLWSTVRPNRRSHCLVLDPRDDLVVSTGFAVLTPESVGPSLLYGLTERDEFVDYLVSVADGSAYPAVRAERFSEARIPLPSPPSREFYEDITMPLRRLSAAALIEAEALAHLRDALLPKLLSGEVRVRDAEPLVEEVV